jgi:hypothetical protein
LARKININIGNLPPKWTLSDEASAAPDSLGGGSDCALPPASFKSQTARFTRGFSYNVDSTGAGYGHLVSVVSFTATSSDAGHNVDIIDSVAYQPCLTLDAQSYIAGSSGTPLESTSVKKVVPAGLPTPVRPVDYEMRTPYVCPRGTFLSLETDIHLALGRATVHLTVNRVSSQYDAGWQAMIDRLTLLFAVTLQQYQTTP